MKFKIVFVCILSLFTLFISCSTVNSKPQALNYTGSYAGYDIDSVVVSEDFSNDLSNWIIETDTTRNTDISLKEEKLVVDVDCGATIWYKNKLSGNLLIEYNRTVLVEGKPNDRLSDLNQFWMANDPKNADLFTRNGTFSQYHHLKQYYFGIGGRTNTTTRFRKYLGTGERYLIEDLSDPDFLLEANKTYNIKTIVYNGLILVYVNNKKYFSFKDTSPYVSGYFGFRTTESRQKIDDLKIFSLK